MKRLQLFEFEDFSWCPRWMREGLTNYLAAMHAKLGTHELIAPLVARALNGASKPHIIDLCSGGGGPMLNVVREVRKGTPDVTLTLSDLYPNRDAAAAVAALHDEGIRYETSPVDAGDVDERHAGVRTMICSLHHMRPEVARRILADAFHKRQPLCVFEISDNSAPIWLWWLAIPVGALLTLFFTPFVRPLTFRQLFFTYVIPVFPLFIGWDGAASNARTYTKSDLAELLQGLEDEHYAWEIGTVRKPGVPGPMLYVLGLPR